MRVLLAIDGSISSDRARDLVASLTLPAGSRVRVVGVLEHGSELFGLPWMPGVSNDTSTIQPVPTGRFVEELEVAEREIARRNVVVDHLLLRGHAARAIVDEAREFGAEVVVVGSRGHGSFTTAVLGSTSAEIVDHAPCPVLVVRRSRIESVLLAEDGSVGADAAAKAVDAMPILAGLPVTVVSVAEVGIPFAGATPGTYEQVMEPYSEPIESSHQQCGELAGRRGDWLARDGRPVDCEVRDGDPAAEIVAAAAARGTDLVVVGTRGHTGLTRMILGSVARNVLIHAPCSVLVVHQGAAPSRAEEDPAAVAGGAGRN
jgi:nucleotide-binding universal stress UspA family protein